MRFLLMSLLALSSIAHGRTLNLKCEFSYDIDDKFELEIPATVDGDKVTFNVVKENLVTYFIPFREVSYSAIWHNDSKLEFSAKLDGEVLTYNYKFFNYLREETEVVNVFDETRSLKLDFSEINDGEITYFDFKDGEILSSKINKGDWINETGVKIKDCEVVDLDLVKEEEVIRTRRYRRSFWERIFND